MYCLPCGDQADGDGVRQAQDEHGFHVLLGGIFLFMLLLQLLSGFVRVDSELEHFSGSGVLPLVL